MESTAVVHSFLHSFLIVDFSAATWLANNGLASISPSNAVWNEAITFMIRQIGLDKYFLDTQCSVDEFPKDNITDGWISGEV